MFKDFWLNRKINKCLNRLGQRQIRGVQCPDGMDGFHLIDRIVLRKEGVSLVTLLRYEGNIFCAEAIDEWAQIIDGKSYRFTNPLITLDHQISAVSNIVPDVPVDGYLFFDHRARFPKGHPERVIQLDSIPDVLHRVKRAKPGKVLKASWEQLSRLCV